MRALRFVVLLAGAASGVILAPDCVGQTLAITAPALPQGVVNSSYPASAFVASGGTAPYTFTVAGTTPPGLSVGTSTGVLSGTPTIAGTSAFSVQVQDATGATAATGKILLTIVAQLQLVAPPLTNGIVNNAYPTRQFTASGGTPPYAFGVSGGILPPGLSLDPVTGTLTGVPTQTGAFNFEITVQDSGAQSVKSAPLTITINPPPPALTVNVPPLPNGTVGIVYPAQTFSGSGGVPPYSWRLQSGALPAGLTLNSTNGALSGTPQTPGTSKFAVQITDSAGTTAVSPVVTLVIDPSTTLIAIQVPPFVNATVGNAYAPVQFTATGGNPPYRWSIATGTLPSGMTLDPVTGVVSGTPVRAGTSAFSVSVTDLETTTVMSGVVSLTVANSSGFGAIKIPALPAGTVNITYPAAAFSISGATAPLTWSVRSGSLPPGMSLNTTSGVLSGTPTAFGTFTFVVGVVDSLGQTAATGSVALTISPASAPPPIVITVPPLTATAATPFTATFTASGGTPPYTWAVASGALPSGLSVDPASGVISGTATTVGTFTFSVAVTDSSDATAQTSPLTLNVVSPSAGLTITSPDLNPPTVNVAIAPVRFIASGGAAPYTFSVSSGSLPPGLTLDATTGILSGKPTSLGTYVFTVSVTDAAKNVATTRGLALSVVRGLSINVPILPGAVVGTPYKSSPFGAAGGTPPYTWSFSGSLPPGLTFDPATTVISGTPTAEGSGTFTIRLGDSSGLSATTNPLTLLARAALSIQQPLLPTATINLVYPSSPFTATGGFPPYTFSVSDGSLPAGLLLDPKTGLLTGTPTVAGVSTFIVQVKDTEGGIAQTRSLSIPVNAPPKIETTTLPLATVGTAYTQQLQASGSNAPFTWSVPSGSLPSGVTIDAAGKISGTALQPGTSTFTVQVKDAQGLTSTAQLTLIAALPALPATTFGGIPSPADPAQQPAFTLTLASAFPVSVTGQVKLSFESSAVAAADDPAIQFSTGGRTADFTIASGQTSAVFAVPQMAFSTGTVAGTITLSATFSANGTDITPSPAPSVKIVIEPAAPKIVSVSLQSSTTGTEVVVTGFATTRQVTGASFNLTITGGSSANTTATVDLTSAFAQWYQGADSAAFGSSFVYRQPFTLTGPGTIASASVTLTNAQGTSQAVSSR